MSTLLRRRAIGLAAAGALTAATGCGSDPPASGAKAKPRPAVAGRVTRGERFFGFPAITNLTVRTDPAELSADVQGLYADPPKAIAAARRDGFVAGAGRVFKSEGGPDVAIDAVVQMRDARGATAEYAREVDALLHPPCPPDLHCTLSTRRFAVPGIPGAAGLSTALAIRDQPGSVHPDVLRADAIVFRTGAFVQQVFLGTTRPAAHRAALIKAAQEHYRNGG